MADFGGFNLFPIGATGFEEGTNPLHPVAAKATENKSKSFFDFDFSLPKFDFDFSLPKFDIPGSDSLSKLLDIFDKLTSGDTWQRVGIVIVGLVFLTVGLYLFGNRQFVAIRG